MIFPLNSLTAICFDLSSDWLLVLSTSRVIRSGSCFIFGYKLKFFRVFQKKDTPESVTLPFSPKKLVRLFILKKVKPSPNSKMIKRHTSDNLFPPLRHSCAKTLSRMTTAITFLRQKHADSRVSNTQYWENLVFVVVLVSESKALYYLVLYIDVYFGQHLNTGFHDCNLRRSATRSKTVFVGGSLRSSQIVQCCSHLF